MATPVNDEALNAIFREARTHSAWQPKPVDDDLLRRLYELVKWGPTSSNTTPMRVVFVKSHEAKERLKPALMPGNVDKTMLAPVCAIIANDTRFYEFAPKLSPHNPALVQMFTKPGQEQFVQTHILRNGSLQSALSDPRGPRAGTGCRADVRVRQRQT